jgi:hypothetical protein
MADERQGMIRGGWEAIERERRLDRGVRIVCGGAWGLTLGLTATYAVIVVQQALVVLRRQQVGVAPEGAVMAAVTPLIVTLGVLALLVAALSTVAVFLRFRTAALGEIQVRLGSLEAMLLEVKGTEK